LFFIWLIQSGRLKARQSGWFHHYYLGYLIEIAGILMGDVWVYAVGASIKYDDFVQHLLQTFVEPDFQSLLHILAGPLYKFRTYLVNATGWKWLERV
jgi:hypothetical protein